MLCLSVINPDLSVDYDLSHRINAFLETRPIMLRTSCSDRLSPLHNIHEPMQPLLNSSNAACSLVTHALPPIHPSTRYSLRVLLRVSYCPLIDKRHSQQPPANPLRIFLSFPPSSGPRLYYFHQRVLLMLFAFCFMDLRSSE